MAALSTFTAFATPLLLFLAPVIAPYSWLGIFLVVLGMTTGLIAMISGLILLFLKNGKRVRIVGGIIGIVIGFLGFWEELKIRKLL